MPNPTPFKQIGGGGYHDFYVGYDPATQQDKFYGAGLGGYSVWDVTKPEAPKSAVHDHEPRHGRRAHVHAVAGRSLCGDRDGVPVHAAPHLGPRAGQSGKTQNIDIPISAWTADWRDLSHNHEVRWPYVFVSAYEDGLQVFNLKDPKNPKTEGHFFTCECEHEHGFGGSPNNGWQSTTSVDAGRVRRRRPELRRPRRPLRHAHGLWLFKMDGFNGWNGHDVGMPNISSVQDWDRGPDKTWKPKVAS